jgi:hypothetical protein
VAHSQTKRKLAEAEAALLAVQPKEAKKPKLTAMTRPLTAFGVTVTRTKKPFSLASICDPSLEK